MAKTLAELRQRRQALASEADTMMATAVADGDRDLTAVEATRLTAIKAELAEVETERCALEDTMSTPDQMAVAATTATTDANKRALDIAAACELAGKPGKAHGFIASGKSAEVVIAELKAENAEPVDDVNPRSGRSAAKPDTAAAWDKAIDRVNARIPGGKVA